MKPDVHHAIGISIKRYRARVPLSLGTYKTTHRDKHEHNPTICRQLQCSSQRAKIVSA